MITNREVAPKAGREEVAPKAECINSRHFDAWVTGSNPTMHALFPCFSTVILIHKFLSLTGWITNYRFRHLAKTVTTKLTIAALCAVEKKDSFSQPMKLQEKLSDVVKVNEIRPLKIFSAGYDVLV